jgi:hypothetical protein
MTTATENDFAVTGSWQNVVATLSGIASVDTLIQNLSTVPVWVVSLASGGPPTSKTGVVLGQYDSMTVNAAQVWVRTPAASASISVTKL